MRFNLIGVKDLGNILKIDQSLSTGHVVLSSQNNSFLSIQPDSVLIIQARHVRKDHLIAFFQSAQNLNGVD